MALVELLETLETRYKTAARTPAGMSIEAIARAQACKRALDTTQQAALRFGLQIPTLEELKEFRSGQEIVLPTALAFPPPTAEVIIRPPAEISSPIPGFGVTAPPITETPFPSTFSTSNPAGFDIVVTGNTGQPEQIDEKVLVDLAKKGDPGAFDTLHQLYQSRIYNFLYRSTGNPEDAADMTQDTFLKAYKALPKIEGDLIIGAWLYRIATNVFLDEQRHQSLVRWQPWESFISVFHPSQVARDNPLKDFLDRENREEVKLILNQLRPRHRVCLVLREYHDLSYDEIAAVLNTTRAAVKSSLFRAREEFRQVYAKAERKPGVVAN